MQQEDYNSLMKLPWEPTKESHKNILPKCPKCDEPYCGDGVNLCTECDTTNERKVLKPSVQFSSF